LKDFEAEGLMKHAIATVVLAGAVVTPAWAQNDRYREPNEGSRYSADAQHIPPGYLPPPGACRVWYDGRPPGHQPRVTSCADAERIARRERNARVVYGGDRDGYRYGETRRGGWPGRAVPRNPAWSYPYDNEARAVPYEQGFKDGRDKGRDDRSDDKRFDPTRHSRYRDAERGYERRYGDKDEYRATYREGFRAGYAEGYRGVMMTRGDR
jgi:hypothetical protein